jgi:hypothetical protein
VTLATSDRVLVPNQTSQNQNGIYLWNGAAVPMNRAPDANTANELEQAVVTIEEGSSAGTTYRQTQLNFTLDTDPVIWTTFGTSAPPASETSAGIAEIATQTEVNAGTDDLRIVTPAKLANWSGRSLQVNAVIGDGSATQFDVTHNFNTRNLSVEVYRNSAPHDTVLVDVERPTVNAVRVRFGAAPASNSYVVVVQA